MNNMLKKHFKNSAIYKIIIVAFKIQLFYKKLFRHWLIIFDISSHC